MRKKVFSLKCIQKSNVIKKKSLGFSIWIYVFGFSRCNGFIIYFSFSADAKMNRKFNFVFIFSAEMIKSTLVFTALGIYHFA